MLHRTNNKSLPGLKSVVSSSFDKKVTEYKGFEQFGALPAVLLDSKASYVVQSYIKVRVQRNDILKSSVLSRITKIEI